MATWEEQQLPITSFIAIVSPSIDTAADIDPAENDVYDAFQQELVDYINPVAEKLAEMTLPGETPEEVISDAIWQLYYDVTDFSAWYWNPEDPRVAQLLEVKNPNISNKLRATVSGVVKDNLEELRAVNQIPDGQDNPGLEDQLTNDLSKYVAGWEDWYWDFKKESDIDDYYSAKAVADEMYLDSDYGDGNNIMNIGEYGQIYDGYSDVPWIAESE